MFGEMNGSGRRLAALAAVAIVGLVAVGPQPATGQDRGVVARVEILGDIKGEKPVAAKARIARVGNGAAEGAVGKYLEGTAKILNTDKGMTAQIRWTSLRETPGTGPAAAVPGLASLVNIREGAALKGGAQIPVSGDLAALIRAAKTLDEAGEKKAEKDDDKEDDEKTAKRDSQAQGKGSLGGGSTPFQNSLATPPQISAPPVEKTTTETIATDAFGTTKDGCEPEFDPDQNVMIVMEAPTKNGEKTGACERTIEELPIKKSHVGCGYEIDEESGVAYSKVRRYYTYGPNTTYLDDSCAKDEEQSFKIEEAEAECTVHHDLAEMVATQWTKLVFRGIENETVVAEGCEARNGATFEITNSTDECQLRDDFDAGRTWVQHRPVYTGSDGLKRVIGECTDTETFYAHIKDTTVCDPIADYEEGKLFDQYRIRIEAPVENEFRTGACKPNVEATTELEETGEGCESFHADYDGYSLGGTRVLRRDTGAVIRGCSEAAIRYDHVREAQGWQYDDAKLQAFPKEALYIVLPQPAGKNYIEQAVVRDDSQPTAYTLKREYLKETSASYVDGSCDKYIERRAMKVYERPDGTEYEFDSGAGTPAGPTDACTSYIPSTWGLYTQSDLSKSKVKTSGYDQQRTYDCTTSRSARYSTTRTVEREDGALIVSEAGVGPWVSCGSSTFLGEGGCNWSQGNISCNGSYSGQSTIQNWSGSLGWTQDHPVVYQ